MEGGIAVCSAFSNRHRRVDSRAEQRPPTCGARRCHDGVASGRSDRVNGTRVQLLERASLLARSDRVRGRGDRADDDAPLAGG